MCPPPYYDLMRNSKDPRFLRLRMVQYAAEQGVKPAARAFATTPKTVRKWLRRWKPGTLSGLEEESRAPKNPTRKITNRQRNRVIQLKKKHRPFGAERLKRDYQLPLSAKAIRKIWREEGLLKKRRKKHKTKQDLRDIKAQWRLFEQVCIDTKDLDDIPELWPQIQRLQLPTVQYTAREVVSGMHFLAYADDRSLTYATLFVELLIRHLRACGVDLAGCRFQTDNGSEFIGSWQAKDDSLFTQTVQAVPGLQHTTIPPGAHTWQADVETAHNLIESEFYEVESFTSRSHFLNSAATYNLFFNLQRKNSYKKNRTPWEIALQRQSQLNPRLPRFPPLFLDQFFKFQRKSDLQGGDDVIPLPLTESLFAGFPNNTPQSCHFGLPTLLLKKGFLSPMK